MYRPILAISMGDPAGIGPEIAVKAMADWEVLAFCRPIVVGDAEVLNDAVGFTGVDVQVNRISRVDQARFEHGAIDVIDLDNVDMATHTYGVVSGASGDAAFAYVKTGVQMAMDGEVDALVTGPINKESLNMGRHHYSGHTEILADLTATRDYAMMLIDGSMRVAHVTTHVPLKRVSELIKKDRVLTVITLVHRAAKALGVAEPRVGVAGLNPHAGEGSLFGTEEIEEISPAIEEARNMGIHAEGPVPPDTLFAKLKGGLYDAAVAMYHDQGHIPLKTLGFHIDHTTGKWVSVSGVNVTLGLPIIRTSVDHGTAFDQAGKGTANPESLVQAMRTAALLAADSSHRRSSCE